MHMSRNPRQLQARVLAALAAATLVAGPMAATAQTPTPLPTAPAVSTNTSINRSPDNNGINRDTITRDVVGALEADGRFSTLVTALRSSGLAEELKTGGPYTVFAPTDEAFRKLPQDKRDSLLANREQLRDVLQYHVVSGRLTSADLRNMESVTQTNYHSSTSPAMRRTNANSAAVNATTENTRDIDTTTRSTADGNQARPDSQEGFMDKMLKDRNEPGDAYDPKGAVNELLGRDKDSTQRSDYSSTNDTSRVTNVDRPDGPSNPARVDASDSISRDITDATRRRMNNEGLAGGNQSRPNSQEGRMDHMLKDKNEPGDAYNGNTASTTGRNDIGSGNQSRPNSQEGRIDHMMKDKNEPGDAYNGNAASTTGRNDIGSGNQARPDSQEGRMDRMFKDKNEPGDAYNGNTANRNTTTMRDDVASGNRQRPDSQEGRVDRMFKDENETGDAYNRNTTTTRNTTDRDVVNSDVASGNQPRPDNKEGVIDRMLKDENEPGDAYAPGTTSSGRDLTAEASKAADEARDWVSEKSRNLADSIDSTIERNGNSQVHAISGGGIRFSNSGSAIMVNNARVVGSDITASNGVIHAIDTVLTPDRKVSRGTKTTTTTTTPGESSQAPRVHTTPYESASLAAPEPYVRSYDVRQVFDQDRRSTTLMPGTTQVQHNRDDRF